MSDSSFVSTAPIILEGSNNELFLSKTKAYEVISQTFSKRRNVNRLTFLLTVLVIASLYFCLPSMQLYLPIATSILYSWFVFAIIYTFYWSEFFSSDAYVTVAMQYFLNFATLVVIPVDIAILAITNQVDRSNAQEVLNIIWKVIFLLTVFFIYIILNAQTIYWRQGHSTPIKKIRGIINYLKYKLAIIVPIFVLAFVYLCIKYSANEVINALIEVANLFNFLYSLVIFMILLGFGLVEVPLYLFNYTSTESKIRFIMNKLMDQFEDANTSLNIFILDSDILVKACDCSITNNLSTNEFAQQIKHEISQVQLKFNSLFCYNKDVKPILTPLKKKNINEDILSDMFTQIKDDIYFTIQKRALMLKTYDYLISELELYNPFSFASKTKHINATNIKPSYVISKKSNYDDSSTELLFISAKEYGIAISLVTKALGVLVSFLSIFVVAIQFSLIFKKENIFTLILSLHNDNFFFYYISTILYMTILFIYSYYALTYFKISDSYLMVKHYTSKYNMANNAALTGTLLLAIINNLIVLIGKANISKNTNSIMINFSKKLDTIGILFDLYSYYFPILLLLVILIFVFRKLRLMPSNSSIFMNSLDDDVDVESSLKNDHKVFEMMRSIENIYKPVEIKIRPKRAESKEALQQDINAFNSEVELSISSKLYVKPEITFSQGFMYATTNEVVQSTKMYVKLSNTNIIICENISQDNMKEYKYCLSEIKDLDIIDSQTLRIEFKNDLVCLTPISSTREDQQLIVNDWLEMIISQRENLQEHVN